MYILNHAVNVEYRKYSNVSVGTSSWETEAGGSGLQGHPQPCDEFKARLVYMRIWKQGRMCLSRIYNYRN